MALFCQNVCKFRQCGLYFATLYDLIQHIEETHINCDPEFLLKQEQQQPNCVALSYVYKVFREPPEKKPKPIVPEPLPLITSQATVRKKASSNFHSMQGSSGYRYQTEAPNRVVANYYSADNSDSVREYVEDHSTSGTEVVHSSVVEEILNSPPIGVPAVAEERKFKCQVSGCSKTYKNLNGMRYHTKIAHSIGAADNQQLQGRIYRCHCGKDYKTTQGLQNHMLSHKRPSMSVPASPNPSSARPTLFVAQNSAPQQSLSTGPSPSQSPAPATSAAALAGGHQYHQPASPATSHSSGYQQSRNISYHQINRSGGPYNLSTAGKRPGGNNRNFQRGKLMLNSAAASAPNLNTIQISDIIVTERN